jgi:hypothetical protein
MAERSQSLRTEGDVPREQGTGLPASTELAPPAVENQSQKATPQPRTRPLDELLQLSGLRPESRLTLTEVAVIIGSQTGRRPSSSTCWRWALKGVRGKKLDVIRIGGTLYTTLASVEAFLDGQPSTPSAGQPPPPSRPARITAASQMAAQRRQREREAAKRHLDDVCSPRRKASR